MNSLRGIRGARPEAEKKGHGGKDLQKRNERVRIYLRFLSAALMAVRRTHGITTGVERVVLAAAACNNHSQQLNSTARLLQWSHTHTHTHTLV